MLLHLVEDLSRYVWVQSKKFPAQICHPLALNRVRQTDKLVRALSPALEASKLKELPQNEGVLRMGHALVGKRQPQTKNQVENRQGRDALGTHQRLVHCRDQLRLEK